jgi:hypothetical protein
MEGGSRPEDVSLLETGGGAAPLISVQGGGGYDAGTTPKLQPAEGGGLLDWLSGNPSPFKFNSTESFETIFNRLWATELSPYQKMNILKNSNRDLSKNGDAVSNNEAILRILMENTANEIEKSDGEKISIEDHSREANINEKSLKVPLNLDINRHIIPKESQRVYRKYENKVACKRVYKILEKGTESSDHPIVTWVEQAISKSESRIALRNYLKRYTKSKSEIRKRVSGMMRKIAVPNIEATSSENGYTYEDTLQPRYVACLDISIEHIVVVPPFDYCSDEPFDLLKHILINLYNLNVLSVSDNNVCKINRKVALIFPSLYKKTQGFEENLLLFLIASHLELENINNIFVLSNTGYSSFGCEILNYSYNESTSTKPSNIHIPTLLSPTDVLFPYKLGNDLNGMIISAEKNQEGENKTKYFNDIYNNIFYGKIGFGFFVEPGYNFIEENSKLIRYNFKDDDFYNEFKGSFNFGDDEIKSINFSKESITEFEDKKIKEKKLSEKISPIIDEIFSVIDDESHKLFEDIDEFYSKFKDKTIYFQRNMFIVRTEIFLDAYNIIKDILEGMEDKEKSKTIEEYFKKNINYIKYIRYPLTEEYGKMNKLYKESNRSILRKPSLQSTGGGRSKKATKKLLIGGAGKNCRDMQEGPDMELDIFNTEQISPTQIFILSMQDTNVNGNGTCDIKDDKKSNLSQFRVWHKSFEIADFSNQEIIDVGSKTYAIRVASEDVKRNWKGYLIGQSGGGNQLSEYEEEYKKILGEITTTLGEGEIQKTIQNGGAIDEMLYPTTPHYVSCISSVSSISSISSCITEVQEVAAQQRSATTNEAAADMNVPLYALGAVGAVGAVGAIIKNSLLKKSIPVEEEQLGGKPESGYQQKVPILTEGEADLLNDLNLSPINMSEIFSSENRYFKEFNITDLKSWDTAICMFLDNLVTQSCYKNSLLLTHSECEKSKCFLFSIRDYLDKPEVNREIQTGILMNDNTAEFNEPDIENDSEIILSDLSMPMGRYFIDKKTNKPCVNVAIIEKRTNVRQHFLLSLEETVNPPERKKLLSEEKERLKGKFRDLQIKYSAKYVMYLY